MTPAISRRSLLAGAAGTLAMPALVRAASTTDLQFYFPVAVGGPITKIIDSYAADFMKENPDIHLSPVYAGSYVDTLTKTITAVKSGQGPALALTSAVDVYTLIDGDLIVPIDSVAGSAGDKTWLDGFYPAFMRNGQVDGHAWGVPFQRSTIVMYWNKDAFREAGLDPEHAPATWEEMATAAQKLTRREGDKVSRWGLQIPGTGFTYWLYQALAIENGRELADANGTKVSFDDPACAEALQFWIDLTSKWKAHPPGIADWATTPRDFLEGRIAMMWHTTGNLSSIRANAKFPFGVGMLPAHTRRGSPTGGGNFHLFKSANEEQKNASLRLLKWLTTPERAAQWCIDTGYVATRPDAWETGVMKKYAADFPAAAVARDQLPFSVAELSTHDNQRVTKALDDELQAALLGNKTAPAALASAEAAATRILRPYAR